MAISDEQIVTIQYEAKVDGNIIDSNIDKEPLEFVFGKGQIIPGLESRIATLNEGEEASVVVPANEAYGEYNEEAMQKLPKSQLEGIELSVGLPLQGNDADGKLVQVVVKEIYEDEVLIDFNHQLAGKDMNFNVKILSIK